MSQLIITPKGQRLWIWEEMPDIVHINPDDEHKQFTRIIKVGPDGRLYFTFRHEVVQVPNSAEQAEALRFTLDLLDDFPGLNPANDEEVNGADLVQYLTEKLEIFI